MPTIRTTENTKKSLDARKEYLGMKSIDEVIRRLIYDNINGSIAERISDEFESLMGSIRPILYSEYNEKKAENIIKSISIFSSYIYKSLNSPKNPNFIFHHELLEEIKGIDSRIKERQSKKDGGLEKEVEALKEAEAVQ